MPWWYSPWAHLAFPSAVGLGLIALPSRSSGPAAGRAAHRPDRVPARQPERVVRPPEHPPPAHLAARGPLLAAHARAPRHLRARRHGDALHAGVPAGADPVLRHRGDLPHGAPHHHRALATLVSRNVACLWVATPWATWSRTSGSTSPTTCRADSPIGRSGIIGVLRRHHALHHTPELMQHWNFNVTVPLADWILRTTHPGTRAADRRSAARAISSAG